MLHPFFGCDMNVTEWHCVQGITKQALVVLKALAGNDDIKVLLAKAGGIQLVLAAMTQHQGNLLRLFYRGEILMNLIVGSGFCTLLIYLKYAVWYFG